MKKAKKKKKCQKTQKPLRQLVLEDEHLYEQLSQAISDLRAEIDENVDRLWRKYRKKFLDIIQH